METYFEQLVRLMEVIDECSSQFEEDDLTLPQRIREEFNDNDHFFDVSMLRMMIDHSIFNEQFMKGKKTISPEGQELHNTRIQNLRRFYITEYLPALTIINAGNTLRQQ